nr:AIPR family protein [uncultured Macellibacteroides sp.]
MTTYLDIFKSSKPLIEKYGINKAYLVWVMGLYLDYSELNELADESLTDDTNDKKIDFIRIDYDNKKIVFVQGYFSERKIDAAPSNKASDLNTAAAWLISGNIDDIPSPLKEIIKNAREVISSNEIEQIELLYLHNLPESVNVAKELKTVKDHLENVLASDSITVVSKELGLKETQYLFDEQSSQIIINELINCPAKIEFEESGDGWSSGIMSVPGAWLRQQYIQYQDKLFSANYRGFLGISKRKRINTGIKSTAEKKSTNFWAYNNGITILTHNYEKKVGNTILTGMSIINGAQTTGSIGSLDSTISLDGVRVLTRIIKCSDRTTIDDIVKFNNTQNKITTWDKFSNDTKQLSLLSEFTKLGHDYSFKRGFSNKEAEISIENSMQPLIAFISNFNDANRGKNSLFENDKAYKNAFEDVKARHILLVHCINKAIDNIRFNLKLKKKQGTDITNDDEFMLTLFTNLRFKFFLIAVVGASMETLMGRQINLKYLSLTNEFSYKSNKGINDIVVSIQPIIEVILTFTSKYLEGKNYTELLRQDETLTDVSKHVSSMINASKVIPGMTNQIQEFAKLISIE